jgi:deoxyribodipyrimidine photolyase
MRIIDHMPLAKAHTECEKVDHLFIFDPRNYKDTRRGNLKANMRRLKFQVECLNDVANSLKKNGCSMTILLGEPEVVISEYAKAMKLKDGTQVYCYDDVGDEETKVLKSLKRKLQESGIDTNTAFGGGTLFDMADLPYPVQQLNGFTEFRKSVERPAVLAKLKAPLKARSVFMPAASAVTATTVEPLYKTISSPIADVAELWSTMRNWYGEAKTAGGGVGKDFSTTIDARAVMDFHGGITALFFFHAIGFTC